MNEAQTADIIWYLLAFILVGSALFSRRFSMRSAFAMALGWIAIFGIMLIAFSYRSELGGVATKVKDEVSGAANQRADGQEMRIRMAPDGHFWVDAEINGYAARFLIDSGATITALSEDVAKQAGLNIDESGPGAAIQTANGTIIARRSSIAGLSIGTIKAQDLPIMVSDKFGGTNVLGMNFLSRLKSWKVQGEEMILEP